MRISFSFYAAYKQTKMQRKLEAYNDLEKVCQDNKESKDLSELITNNLTSCMSYQDSYMHLDIDDKVQDLKKQITTRRILEAPKFGSWQEMGVTDKEWNQ